MAVLDFAALPIALTRTEGDSEDPLRMAILTRTGLSTTAPEDLTGSSVNLSIFAQSTPDTALVEFTDVLIPPGDIVTPLAGEIDYILSAPQIAELLADGLQAKRYLMRNRVVFPSTKQRFYPNDLLADGVTIVTFAVLVILPGN